MSHTPFSLDTPDGLSGPTDHRPKSFDQSTSPSKVIQQSQSENSINALGFPSVGALGGDYMQVEFSKYVRPSPNVPATASPNLTIQLPLPRDLQEVNSVRLDPQDTRIAGQLTNILDTVKDKLSAGSQFLENPEQLIQRFKKETPAALGLLAASLSNSLSGGTVLGVPMSTLFATVGQYSGVTLNPQISVFFQGVDIRPPMEFSWLFSPKNEREFMNVKRIIKEMRQRVLPRKSEDSAKSFLSYPNLVNIKLYPWEATHGEDSPMPRYKSGFIEAMHVNYTPSGLSFFHDNNPVFIVLSFIFQEIEVWTAEDYDGKSFGTGEINFGPFENFIEFDSIDEYVPDSVSSRI